MPCRADDTYRQTTTLFTGPVPPDNPFEKRKTHRACVYEALTRLALRKWCWKREVEQMADGILRGRTNGKRNPEQESAGRNVRHFREALTRVWLEHSNSARWTVLNEAGHLCLCLAAEESDMLRVLQQEMAERRTDAGHNTD